MKMKFKVTYDDGREVEALAKPRDIVAFERQYGQSMANFGSEENPPPMEWLFYLAWSPLHRSGAEPRAFDEFLEHVDGIEPDDEKKAEEVVPFEKAASAEPPAG